MLNGDLTGEHTGELTEGAAERFGFGPQRGRMAGAPHMEGVTFTGEFPLAHLAFASESFPGAVAMTAFNPFIPLNDRDSSIPAADRLVLTVLAGVLTLTNIRVPAARAGAVTAAAVVMQAPWDAAPPPAGAEPPDAIPASIHRAGGRTVTFAETVTIAAGQELVLMCR